MGSNSITLIAAGEYIGIALAVVIVCLLVGFVLDVVLGSKTAFIEAATRMAPRRKVVSRDRLDRGDYFKLECGHTVLVYQPESMDCEECRHEECKDASN